MTSDGMPLRRIVYISRATLAFDRQSLDQLAAAASRRNREVAITGALIHSVGHFMQWFEGPEAAVVDLWRRLNEDPRHGGFRVLADSPIEARKFLDWAMLRLFDEDGEVDRAAPLATIHSAGVAARLFDLSLPRMLQAEAAGDQRGAAR